MQTQYFNWIKNSLAAFVILIILFTKQKDRKDERTEHIDEEHLDALQHY